MYKKNVFTKNFYGGLSEEIASRPCFIASHVLVWCVLLSSFTSEISSCQVNTKRQEDGGELL